MYHSKKYIKGGSWYQTNKPVKADLSLDQTIKDVASTISPASLPSATSLTGAELAVVNQNGENVQTTTQDIADLGGGPVVESGTYTPTVAAISGVSGGVAIDGDSRYHKIDNIVTVSGSFIVQGSGGGATTSISLSLPFPVTFSNENEASGTATGDTFGTTIYPAATVSANTATANTVKIKHLSPNNSVWTFRFIFQYQI